MCDGFRVKGVFKHKMGLNPLMLDMSYMGCTRIRARQYHGVLSLYCSMNLPPAFVCRCVGIWAVHEVMLSIIPCRA